MFTETRCNDHGSWGGLVCPWPNCSNGLPEGQFKVDSLIEGEPSDIYSRREWRTLNNESYYSWDQDTLPNWFSCPNTFWNEARRKKLVATEFAKQIYHYTSIEGFFGIVKSKGLWLSDYSYLNDKRELVHGIELIQDITTELLKNETRQLAIDLLNVWSEEISSRKHLVYVASFSSDDDSLSQWRSYGQIALGFKPYTIQRHAHPASLQRVEYDRDTQRALIQTYLHHLREAYMVDIQDNRLERIHDVYHMTDRLIQLVAFFKDPGFRGENEYRLAYIEDPQLLEQRGVPAPTKQFRVNRSKIFPYILSSETKRGSLSERPFEINEVVLGPEADDLLERGVRELLQAEGMSKVKVRRSKVPYRT